jgi:K+-sensing histidine kinase KdpD
MHPLPPSQDAIQQRLIATAMHDIIAPIASIIGALEIYQRLKDQLPPDKQDALINTAIAEAHKLNDMLVKSFANEK